jgi:hypothetical protein
MCSFYLFFLLSFLHLHVYTVFGPPSPSPYPLLLINYFLVMRTLAQKEISTAGHQWLTPLILATQETEIRRTAV